MADLQPIQNPDNQEQFIREMIARRQAANPTQLIPSTTSDTGKPPIAPPTVAPAAPISHNPAVIPLAAAPQLIHSAPYRVLSKITSAMGSPAAVGAAKGLQNILMGAEEGLRPALVGAGVKREEAPSVIAKNQASATKDIAGAGLADTQTTEAPKLTNIKQQQANTAAAGEQSRADTADRNATTGERAEQFKETHPKAETPQTQAFKAALEQTKTAGNPAGDPVAAYQNLHGPKDVTLDIGGKPVGGKVTEQGDYLLSDGSPAPQGTHKYIQPNYGQMVLPTKTKDLVAPDGRIHTFGWNTQSGTYDKDMGQSASGALGHQEGQAASVNYMADQVIKDVKAHSDKLGDLASWVKQYGLNTPVADPELAGLYSELKSLADMQPALHAFRAASAAEGFEKMIAQLQKDPLATIATIEGLKKTTEAINPNLKTKNDSGYETGKTYTGKTGSFKFKGGDPKDAKNWEKQ